MDPIKSVALAALALVALGTDHGVGESLHFAPAPELALRKSLTVSHELSIDSIGYSRDGVTTNTEQPSGWISTWLKVTAVDRYDEVADGRPLRFARTYVELGARGKLTMQQGPGGAMQ